MKGSMPRRWSFRQTEDFKTKRILNLSDWWTSAALLLSWTVTLLPISSMWNGPCCQFSCISSDQDDRPERSVWVLAFRESGCPVLNRVLPWQYRNQDTIRTWAIRSFIRWHEVGRAIRWRLGKEYVTASRIVLLWPIYRIQGILDRLMRNPNTKRKYCQVWKLQRSLLLTDKLVFLAWQAAQIRSDDSRCCRAIAGKIDSDVVSRLDQCTVW